MAIWTAEIKEIEKLYASIKGQLPDLEKELERLIKADDENMILLYSRRCLEVIITDLCECELKRPRKTEPLKGIIDKLLKEDKVPSHIITSMHGLNDLSTYGTHPKDFDPEQVKPVLVNLDIIIKWYLKYKQIVTIGKTKVEEERVQLRKEPLEEVKIEERTKVQEKPANAGKRKLITIVAFVAILIITAILAYPKIFKRDTLEKLRSSGERISVAVMPFQNMTGDTTKNFWQEMIQDNLITSLSNSEELKVRQTESINHLIQSKGLINYASITPSIASNISQKLDANVFIYGSINQSDTILRIYTRLIDSKTEEVFKSFKVDGNVKKILFIIDSLSTMVKDFLVLSKLKNELPSHYHNLVTTSSPEAYKCFKEGYNAFNKLDWLTAKNMFSQAIAIDSNLSFALILLAATYGNQGLQEQGKELALRAYNRKDFMPRQQKLLTAYTYYSYYGEPNESIKYLKQLLEIDDQSPIIQEQLGVDYSGISQYDKAIPQFEKTLNIYEKWGLKPEWALTYAALGNAYHNTGQYKKEKKLYRKAEQDFPDDTVIIYRQAILSLTEGDSVAANRYIEKYMSICKDNASPEANTLTDLASIYSEAGIVDKAEKYYRQALSLEPDSLRRMNQLAYFLIDKDRNINEGLELVDTALNLRPNNYNYLHTKGWGLFKQGKYQEALEILQKSWDLRRLQAGYNHTAFLHLEAAKKAVAGQKNN